MASGDTLFILLPLGSIPTTTVPATHDTVIDASTVVGQYPVLDFAGATADESAEWLEVVPSHYDGGGFTFEINVATDGVDVDAMQYEIRAISTVATNVLTSEDLQAATPVEIADVPSSTANALDVTPTGALSHANAGSPAVGDIVRIRVSRDFDHAANADDAQVAAIVVTET